MPFLTDEEIISRKNSPDNLVNRIEIHKIERGKKPGDIHRYPDSLRKTVATLDISGIPQNDIGEMLNLHQSQVSRISQGKDSAGGRYKEDKNPVKEIRSEAENKAINVMLEALEILGPQIADIRKPKLLSSIAKDMTFISDRMRPRDERNNDKNVHLHLYVPKMKEVNDYETIDAPID